MPSDWFTPTTTLFTGLAWPSAVVILLLVFRGPIIAFIDDIYEFTGFGTSAKRDGNRRSERLRAETQAVSSDTGESPEEGRSDISNEVESAEGLDDGADGLGQVSNALTEWPTGLSTASGLAFLRFYRGLARLKIKTHHDKSETTSARLAAEIVSNSYSDLRLSIRVCAFFLQGPESVSGPRGRKALPQMTLKRLNAPVELIDLVREAWTFSKDIDDGAERVDGRGADAFIDSCLEIQSQLFNWAEEQLEA